MMSGQASTVNKTPKDCKFCEKFEEELSTYESKPKPWTTGKIVVTAISGAIVAGSFAVTVPFIAPAFRRVCVPYIPATSVQINNVLAGLKGRTGKLVDIGSGDGRVVIAASKEGFTSHGVELNYWLVLYSRLKAWREGQSKATAFFKKDLWKTNLSTYQNITVFGTEALMEGLEKKLEKEAHKDCTVLASRYQFPKWQPVQTIGDGLDTVWVYRPRDPFIAQTEQNAKVQSFQPHSQESNAAKTQTDSYNSDSKLSDDTNR